MTTSENKRSMRDQPGTSVLAKFDHCTSCGQGRMFTLYMNAEGDVIDSEGGMLFDSGWECDGCL